MSKRIVAFFLAAILTLGMCMSVSSAHMATDIVNNLVFGKSVLTAGEITVSGKIIRIGSPEDVLVSFGFYRSDGTLEKFSPAVCSLEAYMGSTQASMGEFSLKLEVPKDVTRGDYVKVIAMSKATLKPYSVQGTSSVMCESDGPVIGVETVYDKMYERFYTLDGADGSIAIESNAVVVRETGTSLRLKDLSEGEVAFVDGQNSKRRIADSLRTLPYIPGSASQRWKMVAAEDGYYIQNSAGGYLAISGSEAVIAQEPYLFELNLYGETPFTLMTSLDGYKLLPAATQERIEEIFTSVGATVFPDGTNTTSYLEKCESKFADLYEKRAELTPQEQKDEIVKIVSETPIFGGVNEFRNIDELPGGDATFTKDSITTENRYIWDIGTADYKKISVTYKTETTTQTVNFFCEDVDYANVDSAIEALGKFPYEYRKFIKEVCVYKTRGNSAYYCDGEVLTVALSSYMNVAGMMRGFAHELGHSVDFRANYPWTWSEGDTWRNAEKADMTVISDYGNQYGDDGVKNYYEEFAEFARMYFQCYGNRDRQIGMQQLFPQQFASFGRLLDKIGMKHLF